MAIDIEQLRSGGTLPSGPVSAWPKARNQQLAGESRSNAARAKKVNAPTGKMAKGLLRTARQAVMNGKVSAEIREERYNTCKACPAFIEDSKRCADCGCFMEAKTWVGGDPNMLCPQKKWSR